MATQADIDRLSEAMTRAHSLGRIDDARLLAGEIRRLTTTEAEPGAAPERGFAGQVSDAMVGNITGAKAMAQGLPFVGKWTDEAAGWLSSKIHGGDQEQARREYMAPVEAMPAGRRMAAELAGGVAGAGLAALAAPAAFATVPAVLATGVAEGAVSGAGANEENRGMGALSGGVLGGVGGVLGTAVSGLAANAGRRIMNAVRSASGEPVSPFVGRGGTAAQRTLRESAENAAARGEAAPVTDVPLVAQPAGAAAAKRVLAGGGENASKVVGAAKAAIADDEALRGAGARYQEIGVPAIRSGTQPKELAAAPAIPFSELGGLKRLADESPYVAKALKALNSDVRWKGVPRNSYGAVHHVKTDLADQLRRAQRAGKNALAGRLKHVHDEWTAELERIIPDYAEVAAKYAVEARKHGDKVAGAKVAGGASKYTPLEGGVSESLGRLLSESVSGSMPGVAHRGAFNIAAMAARASGKSVGKAEGKRLAAILAEKDPEKIAMAIRMLKQDLTGKRLRPLLVPQFDDAVHGMLRE